MHEPRVEAAVIQWNVEEKIARSEVSLRITRGYNMSYTKHWTSSTSLCPCLLRTRSRSRGSFESIEDAPPTCAVADDYCHGFERGGWKHSFPRFTLNDRTFFPVYRAIRISRCWISDRNIHSCSIGPPTRTCIYFSMHDLAALKCYDKWKRIAPRSLNRKSELQASSDSFQSTAFRKFTLCEK